MSRHRFVRNLSEDDYYDHYEAEEEYDDEERRRDPSDGGRYTRHEFVEYYGAEAGQARWDSLAPAPEPPPRLAPHSRSSRT